MITRPIIGLAVRLAVAPTGDLTGPDGEEIVIYFPQDFLDGTELTPSMARAWALRNFVMVVRELYDREETEPPDAA